MIQIDMDMPENCYDCRFRSEMQCSCVAAEDPGFCVFVGLQKEEWIMWDEWKQKASSGRDPRCPLKEQEAVVRCKDCKRWTVGDFGPFCPYHHDARPDWFCADGERRTE